MSASGFVQGQQALSFFQQSGLPQLVLSAIWDLADVNKDGKLDVYVCFSRLNHLTIMSLK